MAEEIKELQEIKSEDLGKEMEIFGIEADFLDLKTRFNRAYQLTPDQSTVPTHTPVNWFEQFYFYKNSSTYRLYIYINNEWKYIALS